MRQEGRRIGRDVRGCPFPPVIAEKKFDEAFDFLLQKYSTVKSDQQKKIKETLLKFFNMLGNDNDYTKKYRKKFSSIMFS